MGYVVDVSAAQRCALASETALVDCLHKFNHTIANRNPLVLTIQVVIAIGRGNHRYARIEKAKKGAADRACKNGLFSAKFGAKMTSLFAIYTIIGTKTTSNPCCRYGWPSL